MINKMKEKKQGRKLPENGTGILEEPHVRMRYI